MLSSSYTKQGLLASVAIAAVAILFYVFRLDALHKQNYLQYLRKTAAKRVKLPTIHTLPEP